MKKQLTLFLFFVACITQAQVWQPVGGGIIGAYAYTMHQYNNKLYVSGALSMLGPNYAIDCDGTGAWNDTIWKATGAASTGFPVEGMSSIVYNNQLYIGCDNGPNELTIFNGASWTTIDIPTNNASVTAFGIFNGDLIVGGKFDTINGVAAENIAKWNGTTWAPLGQGVDSYVYALKTYNNELYAAGFFLHAGGQPANYIAKWNGASWSGVGQGFDSNVRALEIFNNELYVGGYFRNAGSVPCYSGLAKWNGSALTGVGSVKDYGTGVHALRVYNGELYIGGGFDSIAGIASHDVIRYNGSAFASTGNNLTNSVDCFEEYNGRLYAGGWFCINPYMNCNNGRIAVLDTTSVSGMDLPETPAFAVYPNPAREMINIDLPAGTVLQMTLYDMRGAALKRMKNVNQIQVNDLPDGIYLLEIEAGMGLVRKKIVIAH